MFFLTHVPQFLLPVKTGLVNYGTKFLKLGSTPSKLYINEN
jgi:hypothetical protein